MPEKYTADKVIEQIERFNGNISAVASALGVSRRTIYNYIERHPSVKAALFQAREKMLDMAESKLYQKVLDGSTTELIFFLKTQGKSRGYSERVEVTDAKGEPLIPLQSLISGLREADEYLNQESDGE